jgi:hypothetical protein
MHQPGVGGRAAGACFTQTPSDGGLVAVGARLTRIIRAELLGDNAGFNRERRGRDERGRIASRPSNRAAHEEKHIRSGSIAARSGRAVEASRTTTGDEGIRSACARRAIRYPMS